MKYLLILLSFFLIVSGCASDNGQEGNSNTNVMPDSARVSMLKYPLEKHFKNIRQLTFGGDNAEAYWSNDGKKLVFQAKNEKWGSMCDQIYYLEVSNAHMDSIPPKLLSTGMGRTTCSYFLPGDTTILYASTHLKDKDCPPVPEHRKDGKYVWPVY